MFSEDVVRSEKPSSPSILRLEHVTRRQRVREDGVREHRLGADVLAAALRHLDVARQHLDHLRELRQREVRADLILERADEELLAGVPVEVAVRMPEPDEVERLVPVQPLVAGLQVDRRVPVRAAACVEVAAVDVHPHPAELVDDLGEAAEVDRDQVVDGYAGELAHGLERAARATGRVGGVDLRGVGRLARADDLGPEVARERQQRDRLVLGVRAHEHERVRARGRVLRLVRPPVVADHERRRRLAGDREVEPLRRHLDVDGLRSDRRHRLVEVEVRASGDAGGTDDDDGGGPAEDAQRQGAAAPGRRLRLSVDGDGAERDRAAAASCRCRCRDGLDLRLS